MKIKQDPVSKLWCREDGAVLLPPAGHFKSFRWTFGHKTVNGYRVVKFHGKQYWVHQMVCRAFNGLAPADKPFVDHINRIRDDNRPSNLHFVSAKENADNQDSVDKSVEKYKVRSCDDHKSYRKAYDAAKRAEKKAQGLTYRKGPDGKWGWHPRIRIKTAL